MIPKPHVGKRDIPAGNSNESSFTAPTGDDNEGPWTEVRRRTKSLDDLRRKKSNKNQLRFNVPIDYLSEEQASTVRAAEENLTPAQRAAIDMRNRNLQARVEDASDSSDSEPTPGPSSKPSNAISKGKFADRENEIDDEELDPQAQRAALESWNAVRDVEQQAHAQPKASQPAKKQVNESVKQSDSNVPKETKKPKAAEPEADASDCNDIKKTKKGKRKTKKCSKRSRSKSPKRRSKKNKSRERKERKSKEDDTHLKPMSSHHERKLKDAMRGRSGTPGTPRASDYAAQPANQLPDTSFLAQALNGSSKKRRSRERVSKKRRDAKKRKEFSSSSSSSLGDDDGEGGSSGGSSSSSSSSSSSTSSSDDDSGSDSDSSESSTSSGTSSSSDSSDSRRARRKKNKRKSYRKRKQTRLIKPVPPPTYDGTADAERFHTWLMRMIQYCEEGNVPRDQQVMLASHYLRGRALSFFIQKVSRNHSRWRILDFAKELFNYCFPANYRNLQRDRLRRCFQNDRSVLEYVYELEMLYNLVGITSKREMVIKLWDGFNAHMRRELHREKLNKDVHSWDEIVRAAELVEMAEFEMAPRGKDKPKSNPGTKPENSNSNDVRNVPRHDHKSQKKGKWNGDQKTPQFQQGSSRGPSRTPAPTFRQGSAYGNSYRDGGRGKSSTPQPNKGKVLTEAKKNELVAQNRCFICEEPGHMARNCPQNNTVKSNRKGPPGLSSNALGFDVDDLEMDPLGETTQMHLNFLTPDDLLEPFISDEEINEIFNAVTSENSSNDSLSDTNSETDSIPDLQAVSDTDDDWSDSDSGEESSTPRPSQGYDSETEFSDEYHSAQSYFSPDSEDDEQSVLNNSSSRYVDSDNDVRIPDDGRYHRHLFPACQYTAYINDYKAKPDFQPTIEHEEPPFDLNTFLEERSDGKNKYVWANEAKNEFGYPDSPWSDFHLHGKIDPTWRPPCMGDVISEAAQFVLHHYAPYPGDDFYWGSTTSFRFDVVPVNEEFYQINDFESRHEAVLVPTDLLLTPGFQLATWYAKRRADACGITYVDSGFKGLVNRMGDVYAQGLTLRLAQGIQSYPTPQLETSVRNRFFVRPNYKRETYRIFDRAERIGKEIPIDNIINHSFDVVSWWYEIIQDARTRFKPQKPVVGHPQQRKVHAEDMYKLRLRQEKVRRRHAYQMRKMGDVLARALEDRLEASCPYPGDPEQYKIDSSSRFVAWTSPESRRRVNVIDRERNLRCQFLTSRLMRPGFKPGESWACRLADEDDIPEFVDMDYPRMGKVLAIAAREKLTKFVPYPSDVHIPREEWYMVYRNPDKQSEFVIEDCVRKFTVKISERHLLNPKFDLPNWYRKHVEHAEGFSANLRMSSRGN
ncbi:hypothetical protein VNI00_015886 [Paramarasmius palmivorus]|uniref:CCHC-type domain-containing protein n=1 Tax=Paramarasmius palmivorus TaxID=297713 RepID=A0AAW0BGY4_9AGAR